ncbi:dephospho-CoA kinase [Actibacterium mucosum KCTC 23349]|uniref:Dephospho-CoA kinase n=1 Tax=Actibacterium mucosum KCTC 23349 TaxID=1454373 RepID=A0A037ZMB4_9RHOB|nr:dephospho-CoA kinase [Actibacterium mucosum]KAJ57244.1 dephospho-CoA kinase [Actibacterium mucosum KCTC 23349]
MKGPFLLGLTGSIGMGKSTTAQMFAGNGVPVWDADAAVHQLYAKGGAGVAAIAGLHPPAVVTGSVDRTVLKDWIGGDPDALKRIEDAIHPLVTEHRAIFIAENDDAMVLLFDIPLLFETGAERWLDAVVVVSVPPEIQRERVLARPGMTAEMLNTILAKQMPDAQKRQKADYVIETTTIDAAQDSVTKVLADIRERMRDA